MSISAARSVLPDLHSTAARTAPACSQFYIRYTMCDTASTYPPQSSGLQDFQSEQGQSWGATHERQRLKRKVGQQAPRVLPPTWRTRAVVAVPELQPGRSLTEPARWLLGREEAASVYWGQSSGSATRRGLETHGGDGSPARDTPSTGNGEDGTLHHVPSTTPTNFLNQCRSLT